MRQGKGRLLLQLVWGVGILLLYVPIFTLIGYSFFFSEDHSFGDKVNFVAYRSLLNDSDLLSALYTSTYIAFSSASISVVLGGFAAIAIGRRRAVVPGSSKGRLDLPSFGVGFLTVLPLLLPEIVFGLGLLVWFVLLRISLGAVSLILAHVSFSMSYVFLTVSSRMRFIDHALEDAALDLGADTWQIMGRVYLPLLWPSILAGWVMAFAVSFDDFLISFFTAGSETVTLPLALYSSIKFGLSPSVFAMATIVFVFSFVSAAVLTRLSQNVDRPALESIKS